jgi:peptidoglycan glycosyltransferase
MRSNIQRLVATLMAGFLVVGLALGYWQVIRAPELLARADNPRLVEAERRVRRGRILDRNGVTLAYDRVSDDGTTERVYPRPEMVHVTGFYNLRYGVSNIEATYDETLRGLAGRPPLQVLTDGLLHRPQIGSDVMLTLDTNLQVAADTALGGRRGAVIVLDPYTGAILALVSHPAYDPNRLDETWEALRESPDTPLLNRATQGLYPPGSVFKTVTLAAVLEAGLASPGEVFTDVTGTFQVDDFTVQCQNHPGRTTFDLLHAYAYSCNVAFAELGLRLGAERLVGVARRFGFEEVPALEIPVETSRLVSISSDVMDEATLAATAFGQGELAVTPLQMALVAAVVASGGQMPAVHLVQAVQDGFGQWHEPARAASHPAISPYTAEQLRTAMVLAVEEGNAEEAALPGITVAGKTGTAQVGEPGQLPHAWFIGFAPAEAPQAVVVVLVENGGEGGQVAAPVAREVLERVLTTDVQN